MCFQPQCMLRRSMNLFKSLITILSTFSQYPSSSYMICSTTTPIVVWIYPTLSPLSTLPIFLAYMLIYAHMPICSYAHMNCLYAHMNCSSSGWARSLPHAFLRWNFLNRPILTLFPKIANHSHCQLHLCNFTFLCIELIIFYYIISSLILFFVSANRM